MNNALSKFLENKISLELPLKRSKFDLLHLSYETQQKHLLFNHLRIYAQHSHALENEKTLVFSQLDNITPEQSDTKKSKYIPAKYDMSSTESKSDSEIWMEFRAIGAVFFFSEYPLAKTNYFHWPSQCDFFALIHHNPAIGSQFHALHPSESVPSQSYDG
ncbi:hypothetical protein HD554DRAFT_2035239 [Boletus coccyginus]|nr:hypothetical protein HD554DRAFT_2035239 [Boletus coccyginus]